MALPSWPIAKYQPVMDGFGPIKRALDPLATDMEGGNTRQRPRPGDNVGSITQTIYVSPEDHDTVVEWVKTTLNLGTARFTMPVWLGSSYVTKTVQFVQPGTKLTYNTLGPDCVAITMTLRIYDV